MRPNSGMRSVVTSEEIHESNRPSISVSKFGVFQQNMDKGQNVVIEKFVRTIDCMKGYNVFIMLVVLVDIIMYFINKDNILVNNSKQKVTNLVIAGILTAFEFVDLLVVLLYGVRKKVRWFTFSYVLYSFSCLTYILTFILMLTIDYSFDAGIQWQCGFLAIFRGQVRSIVDSEKSQEFSWLKKSEKNYVVAQVMYIFRLIRAIFRAVYGILVFIFLFMGAVFLNESAQDQNKTFSDLLYYIVVTMSTVGYGDITLQGNSGRLITIIFIIVAIIYIPIELAKSLSLLKNEIPILQLQKQIYGGIITIGPKNVDLSASLRAVFPQKQTIQQLIEDTNTNYEDHPDMQSFKMSVNALDYMIKQRYDSIYLRELSVDQSLLIIVYCRQNNDQSILAQDEGDTIGRAYEAALALKPDNILVVVLYTEKSKLLCQQVLLQQLSKEQFIVVSVNTFMSNIICLAMQYSGFATWMTNTLLPPGCSLNQQLDNITLLPSLSFRPHSKVDKNSVQYQYARGCDNKKEMISFFRDFHFKMYSVVPRSRSQSRTLLVAVIGHQNQQQITSIISSFHCIGTSVLVVFESADNEFDVPGASVVEGNIYSTEFYLQQKSDILVFMENNDGKETILNYVLKSSNCKYTVCISESPLSIQSKWDEYQRQQYICCGIEAAVVMAARYPHLFQCLSDLSIENFECEQETITASDNQPTIEEWEARNSGLFAIFFFREKHIINVYDKQLRLRSGDVITAVRVPQAQRLSLPPKK